uniref:Uncharacterized protein n=1 Tax=Acrobeloides nanus TaxID=290746 RepID=A0A914E0H1_9BILA
MKFEQKLKTDSIWAKKPNITSRTSNSPKCNQSLSFQVSKNPKTPSENPNILIPKKRATSDEYLKIEVKLEEISKTERFMPNFIKNIVSKKSLLSYKETPKQKDDQEKSELHAETESNQDESKDLENPILKEHQLVEENALEQQVLEVLELEQHSQDLVMAELLSEPVKLPNVIDSAQEILVDDKIKVPKLSNKDQFYYNTLTQALKNSIELPLKLDQIHLKSRYQPEWTHWKDQNFELNNQEIEWRRNAGQNYRAAFFGPKKYDTKNEESTSLKNLYPDRYEPRTDWRESKQSAKRGGLIKSTKNWRRSDSAVNMNQNSNMPPQSSALSFYGGPRTRGSCDASRYMPHHNDERSCNGFSWKRNDRQREDHIAGRLNNSRNFSPSSVNWRSSEDTKPTNTAILPNRGRVFKDLKSAEKDIKQRGSLNRTRYYDDDEENAKKPEPTLSRLDFPMPNRSHLEATQKIQSITSTGWHDLPNEISIEDMRRHKRGEETHNPFHTIFTDKFYKRN